jgi:hypothetical protein
VFCGFFATEGYRNPSSTPKATMGQGTPTLWIALREITITRVAYSLQIVPGETYSGEIAEGRQISSETLHQRVNLAGSGMGEFERFTGGRFE